MKIEEMIAANRADCSGCAACANICPKNAINMTRDAEGFSYPKINPELCIKCGRCDATCPSLNFTKNFPDEFPKTFVATYDNDKILRHSSSGGIFTALSELVLNDGGIVFGAAFDKNWRVYHTSAENFDELEKLRGSKYVQSQIGEVYRQVKEALKSRKVLFSGTPCQCIGLKNFLGRDYDNLLTVDVICHGAPSPGLWENYIGELNDAHEVKHVNFRSKRNGWGVSTIDINFADRGHMMIANSKHLYGKLFLKDISDRPSCSACKSKFPNSKSDLTLGDAWGVQGFAPEMYDNRGTSVIFIHTPKGNDFFEQCNLIKKQVKFHAVVTRNYPFMSSLTADVRREKFFADIVENKSQVAVMQKYSAEDDAELRKEAGKKNRRIYGENYRAVAAHIRKKFEKNILVVAAPREDLLKLFPRCNVFFLQSVEEKIICTEEFSSLTFEQKDAAALNEFTKKFNVTEIFVMEEQKIDSPVVNEFLKTCELPIKTLNAE